MKSWLVLMVLIVGGQPIGASHTWAQLSSSQSQPENGSARKNWRLERAGLDTEYQRELETFGQWCRSNQQPDSIADPYKAITNRDLWRQTIFIPAHSPAHSPTLSPLVPPNLTPAELGHGAQAGAADLETRPVSDGPSGLTSALTPAEKLREINDWQAERVFTLAKQAAEENSGGPAIQLLNEVLFFNREHVEARQILGHKQTDSGWALYSDRLEIRKGTREHDICRWPARTYLVATSPNFTVESTASEKQIRMLVEKLERWHYVWRQVYFDYWSNARNVRRWIEGDGSYSFSRRRFKIVFFPDRQSYLKVLRPLVPGVEISTGYYSNPKNASFFYAADDPSAEETWRHELTHQLFREAIGSGNNLKLFENEWIWLDEGAATYAESLVDFSDYVTLGGFDARRMQYARVRLLLEGYQVPLAELNPIGRIALQRRSATEVVRLYGQLAGQFDMLMNDQAGANEAPLISFLQMLYRAKPIRPGKFEEIFGASLEQLDQRYRQYLLVDADRIVNFLSAPELRTELSFAKSTLTEACYPVIGRCHNLVWLDLSGNQISARHIAELNQCQSLQQLILTQCRLEPGVLRALAELKSLHELDLSGSSVSDQQLLELQGQTNLQKITLKSTHITPAGIAKLKQLLPQLEVSQ